MEGIFLRFFFSLLLLLLAFASWALGEVGGGDRPRGQNSTARGKGGYSTHFIGSSGDFLIFKLQRFL